MGEDDETLDEELIDDAADEEESDQSGDGLIPGPNEEDAAAIEELEEEDEEAADENSDANAATTDEATYLPGLKFDTDLVLNGGGNIVICEPDEAWLNWCKKALATPRYQCDDYSDQMGVDVEAAFSATSRAEAEEILRSEIKGALEADPYGRTAHVDSINFNWIAPDAVEASTEISGFENLKIAVSTVYDAGELGG